MILCSINGYRQANDEHNDQETIPHDHATDPKADIMGSWRYPIDNLQAILVDNDLSETNAKLAETTNDTRRPMDSMD